MALYLVHKVVTNVNIPVIGVGGIMDYQDALEFIIVGASAIQVGTANFINPKAAIEIVRDLTDYCVREKISNINQIMSSLKNKRRKIMKKSEIKKISEKLNRPTQAFWDAADTREKELGF